jgi:DNA end-binding protein Ku
MPRPIWKGNISFGLVMIPVSMFSAEAKAAELDLDMVDARDGERIRYQRINERTRKEVPWKSIAKGYLVDDEYVILSPEDFKEAAQDIVKGIEIMEFVPEDSISPLYYQKPYYLAPGKGGEKAYALLREALKKAKRIGIAKAVIHSREHLAALVPLDDMLTLLILRFGEELRAPSELELPRPAKAKVNARELTMAQELMKGMSAEWDPERHHDEYRNALKRFIEQKARSGGKPRKAAEESEDEAPASYNIMDLLKKSMEKQPKKTRGKSAASSRSSRAKRKAG